MDTGMLWLGAGLFLVLLVAIAGRALYTSYRAEQKRREQIQMHKTGVYRQPWADDKPGGRGRGNR